MKFLHIAILGRNIQPPWNEAVKNMAFELASQLAGLGHKVHLVTTQGIGMLSGDNILVHSLPPKGFWQSAIKTLLKLESDHELDLVHLQNLIIHRSFAPFVGLFRRHSRVPLVAYCCQLPRLSFPVWVEVLKKDPSEALFNKLGMLAPSLITEWTTRTIDKTIASSRFIRDQLARSRPNRSIDIIPPFFNTERLKLAQKSPKVGSDSLKVLYLGSHKVLRGEEDFLLMLALLREEFRDLEGIAVTTQPIPSRIRRLIVTHSLDRAVKFLSRSVDLDIPSLIKSVDLYAFTGLSPIGSIDPPLSIIESLILGTPVVSYNTGGIAEILGEDRLVKYGDYVSMANTARRFLDGKLKDEPRPDLLARFSSQRAAKLFESVYETLV